MEYRKKPVAVDAEQWFKVEYDRKPGVNTPPIYHLDVRERRDKCADTKCRLCGLYRSTHRGL